MTYRIDAIPRQASQCVRVPGAPKGEVLRLDCTWVVAMHAQETPIPFADGGDTVHLHLPLGKTGTENTL